MILFDQGELKKIDAEKIRPTEAQITADIYHALKSAGHKCALEFPVKFEGTTKRIDILVFGDDGTPAAAIEVKRPNASNYMKIGSHALNQGRFYTWLSNNGVSTKYVNDVSGAVSFIEELSL